MSISKIFTGVFIYLLILLYTAKADIVIKSGNMSLNLSSDLHCSVCEMIEGDTAVLASSQHLISFNFEGLPIGRFNLSLMPSTVHKTHPLYGNCEKTVALYKSSDNRLELELTFLTIDEMDGVIICEPRVRNLSVEELTFTAVRLGDFMMDARDYGMDKPYEFWSFQGGSYFERYDWIFPLNKGYARENYQGMNVPDYGGGIPVVDLWGRKQGMALASLSMRPEQISLPVHVLEDGRATCSIKDTLISRAIQPGGSMSLLPFAIITHKGDYYNALAAYSSILQKLGMKFAKTPADGFEPEWCAWGYIRNFNKQQILATLDKAKELGFKWVTIDDGWQNADGDWEVDRIKFPGGEAEFKELIAFIHSKGFKVRLWCVPFETHDSAYNLIHYPARLNEYGMKFQSRLALAHPDWFLLNADGSRVQVSYWNSYFLCPAYTPVSEHYKRFVTRAIKEWGVDGLKVDGQIFNAVPPCYNPAHHHKDPAEASYSVPDFMRAMFETACALDSQQVVQLCPCGTNFSIYNLPYTNQTVASDPVSSWQVRSKGKTFKALCGDAVAYSGDHVELTPVRWDDGVKGMVRFRMDDFASTVGIGGVPASKFTMTTVVQADSGFMLIPEKEAHWKKWIEIYEKEKPSLGRYLNLYDIAFDKPEMHAIRKDRVMYYSAFCDGEYSGNIELRGLNEGKYNIIDLESGRTMVTITVENGSSVIPAKFKYYLLLKAVPYL